MIRWLGDASLMGPISDRRQAGQLFQMMGPVVHLRDADTCGVARGLLLRLVDHGELRRIAKSAFVRTSDWEAGSAWERFRLRSVGFGMCIAPDAHLTGASASALLTLPTLFGPPALPIAIRPGDPHTGHDRTPFGRVRRGYLPAGHRTIRSRVRTVSPAFAAVDAARHQGPLEGLVVMDAVLHSGIHRESVWDVIRHMLAYPGIKTAQWALEHADARAESPLETLGRHSFLSAGLPPPLSNVWVRTDATWFRVDHLIPSTGVILEADGAVKYNNRPDADAIVRSEKERERLLRQAGFAVGRYSWSDAVNAPRTIPSRAAQAGRSRPPGTPPTCWTLEPPARTNSLTPFT